MAPQPSRGLAAVLVGSVLVLAAGTAPPPAAALAQTAFDVRLRDRPSGAARASVAAVRLRQTLGSSGLVEPDRIRGGLQIVADRDGFLTGPSNARPASVALDYVRRRAAAFRLDPSDLASLELTRRYTSESGATHLLWQQTFRGIPLFDQGLRANVAADGRLINVGGAPRPEFALPSTKPRLTAAEALRALGWGRSSRATLVLFGDAKRMRLAWRLLVHVDSQRVYDAVVDATNGKTLYRHNLVRHATGLAFENYPGAPVGGSQVSRDFPKTGADPWLTSSTRLFGNNAHVYSDEEDRIDGAPPDAGGPQGGDEIPPSGPETWAYVHEARPASSPGQDCPAVPGCSWNNFDPTPPNFSWRVNREQAGTQLFYFVNRFHDHLRDAAGIGFDEASGNFELADRVHAQVDDGATTDTGAFDDFPDCDHTNNASVIPLPDGEPLLMQIYLWSSACSNAPAQTHDVNAADDAMIVYHEYTHGMTNRLVTDAQGFSGLTGPQSAAMDEGFADWYALDFLNALGVEPDSAAPGELRAGNYLNVELRSQPFDCPVGAAASVCPGGAETGPGGYTYGDFGKILGTPEVHADGEIWAETLWDLRAALIGAHGMAGGIDRARALATDGLRLSPANPSFLDMRNAILQADVNRGLEDRDRIWAVFAARGMGVGASTTGDFDTTPVEDFSVPPQPAPPLPSPPSDEVDPVVSRFSLAHTRFHVGLNRTPVATQRRRFPVGSRFRFTLSEPASVTIDIERTLPGRRVGRSCRRPSPRLRQRPRCTRYRRRGALTRRNRPMGRNRVAFSGRIGVRALRPGRYRATISAVDTAGNESRKRRAAFRIVPR